MMYFVIADAQTMSVPGIRAKEDVGAFRHLVLAQVGHDQPLSAQLVRPLYPRGQHRVALRGVGAHNQHQAGHLNICNRSRIAAILDRPLQTHRRRSLAVAGTVVDVVRPDHLTRQLLHQVAFLVGAL